VVKAVDDIDLTGYPSELIGLIERLQVVPATYLIRRLLLVKNPESCQIFTFSAP
jgi:hypothetical protein